MCLAGCNNQEPVTAEQYQLAKTYCENNRMTVQMVRSVLLRLPNHSFPLELACYDKNTDMNFAIPSSVMNPL